MHGPGLPPQHGPRPSSGSVVALRVLFALLPVLTCGFFAWGAMLRLALVTRATRDWVLLAVSGGLSVVWITLIEIDPTVRTDGWQGNLGAGGSIFSGFATCVYFLIADIKHHEVKAVPLAAPAPWYTAQPAAPAYGYPPAPVAPVAPVPPQPQPHPQPPRIGQVRAELDELSELLRKNQPPAQPPAQDPNQ